MRTLLILFIFLGFSFKPATVNKSPLYHSKSFNMTIKGTSSYHNWTSTVNNVSVQGDFVIRNGTIEKIKHATVQVMTKSIQSEIKSTLMDDRTHATLKADKHPSITFEYKSLKTLKKEIQQTRLEVSGILTIAGKSRNTTLELDVQINEKGQILISGEKKIKMSDYGIKAPVFMLGLMRVGNDVVINFDVVLEQKN